MFFFLFDIISKGTQLNLFLEFKQNTLFKKLFQNFYNLSYNFKRKINDIISKKR